VEKSQPAAQPHGVSNRDPIRRAAKLRVRQALRLSNQPHRSHAAKNQLRVPRPEDRNLRPIPASLAVKLAISDKTAPLFSQPR
jgi:hypothetical protein